MSAPFYRTEHFRDVAQECQHASSASPSVSSCRGNFGGREAPTDARPSQAYLSELCDFRSFAARRSRASTRLGHFLQLERLIEFAGLCGIAFWVGAAVALYLENSHFWTTEATAAGESNPQVVNRSRKEDRLPARMIDPRARSADPQGGFGVVEVGGPLSATITIRDASGRLVFELDPLRRTTVISKREVRGVPPSKDQGGPMAPKSRVVPVEGPGECDRPSSRLVGSSLRQLIEGCHSRVQSDIEWQASLITAWRRLTK
jgi:hypothetical protein